MFKRFPRNTIQKKKSGYRRSQVIVEMLRMLWMSLASNFQCNCSPVSVFRATLTEPSESTPGICNEKLILDSYEPIKSLCLWMNSKVIFNILFRINSSRVLPDNFFLNRLINIFAVRTWPPRRKEKKTMIESPHLRFSIWKLSIWLIKQCLEKMNY